MARSSGYTRQILTNFLGRIRTCRYIFLKNIRKVLSKMSSKRILSVVEDIENSANIAKSDLIDILNSDSNSNDISLPVRKRCKRLIIEDDTDDEGHSNHQQSELWIWKEETNDPKIWNYTEIPGIKVAILSQLETNRYANQIMNNENKRLEIYKTWFPVDCDEIKIYFALCIIMAEVKKTTIQMNWSKKAVIETPIFRQTMPFKRFLQITRYLHFADNNSANNTDKLCKIKPVINFLNQRFKEVYTMQENITIDESLMKYKGRLSCKQFNPSEGVRFGIKFYQLCESKSGYCYDLKMYAGSDKINFDDSVSESVVKELSQSILHKGHTLYLNNCSPKLFKTLINSKTNVVGIVHSNINNMPKDFYKVKLKKGEYIMRSCNGILALKWKDIRDIYILSSKHKTAEMTKAEKNQFNCTSKPKCVIEYNKGMIGIDRQDRMLACFPVMKKCMKGYREVFFYLFDIALFNSYILFSKIDTNKKQTYAEYRIEIAQSLLKNVPLPEYKRKGRLSNGDLPERLYGKHWGHFPKHIDPTPSKSKPSRACKVCTKHKKHSETTWECKRCKVALHVPICFERYHTIEDY